MRPRLSPLFSMPDTVPGVKGHYCEAISPISLEGTAGQHRCSENPNR